MTFPHVVVFQFKKTPLWKVFCEIFRKKGKTFIVPNYFWDQIYLNGCGDQFTRADIKAKDFARKKTILIIRITKTLPLGQTSDSGWAVLVREL